MFLCGNVYGGVWVVVLSIVLVFVVLGGLGWVALCILGMVVLLLWRGSILGLFLVLGRVHRRRFLDLWRLFLRGLF